jgi:DNA-binding LacI/PurR family transcriptional regulator
VLFRSEAGLRVPEDFAVVGFDDLGLAEVLNGGLSTIRQPRDVGEKAFNLLMRMIDDGMPENSDDYEQVVLDTQLIVRDSTGVAANEQNPQRYSSRAVRSE